MKKPKKKQKKQKEKKEALRENVGRSLAAHDESRIKKALDNVISSLTGA
jgi:hypothetical protein